MFGHIDEADNLNGENSNQYWVLKINLKDFSSEWEVKN